MGALFIFILISLLIVSALLFFNKGEKAQEIKSILKDIYENFKELFSNFKKLFLIVKELIQSKLDQKPTQLKDESTVSQSEAPSEPEVTTETEALTEPEVSTDTEEITEPEAKAETAQRLSLGHGQRPWPKGLSQGPWAMGDGQRPWPKGISQGPWAKDEAMAIGQSHDLCHGLVLGL